MPVNKNHKLTKGDTTITILESENDWPSKEVEYSLEVEEDESIVGYPFRQSKQEIAEDLTHYIHECADPLFF